MLGIFLVIVGGLSANGTTDDVEVISLDPENNPVPTKLQKLNKFPQKIYGGGGGLLKPGQYQFNIYIFAGINWLINMSTVTPDVVHAQTPSTLTNLCFSAAGPNMTLLPHVCGGMDDNHRAVTSSWFWETNRDQG
jgi:hypothetical protein